METQTKYIAKSEIFIDAPASEVWRALTTPEMIKQYFFGTDAISDWKEGSELHFKGEYEGKEYHEKGMILKVEKNKLFRYTYLMGGVEDVPDNYMIITYNIEDKGNTTMLSLTQENVPTEEIKNHSEDNWKVVLNSLKDLLEEKN